MSMFGLIVAGRLVQTEFQQLPGDPSKFSIEIPSASEVNHIVIFLTGVSPFPPGLGASVYFGWPDESNQMAWHLLGNITNEKPSAIFKITNLKKTSLPSSLAPGFFGPAAAAATIGFGNLDITTTSSSSSSSSSRAQTGLIGISVESLESIVQATPAVHTAPSNVSSYMEFAQKMLENFVNYASSFGDTNYISLQTVKNWYDNFQRRLQADPNFWR